MDTLRDNLGIFIAIVVIVIALLGYAAYDNAPETKLTVKPGESVTVLEERTIKIPQAQPPAAAPKAPKVITAAAIK